AEQYLGRDPRVDATDVTCRDGRGERLLDDAHQRRAVAHPLARAGGHLVLAPVDQREEEATVPEERERAMDDAANPLGGRLLRACGGLELGPQPLDAVEHHGQEELLLAREVAVERPLADAARLDHVVHLDLVVVAALEDVLGRPQDALAQPGRGWATSPDRS